MASGQQNSTNLTFLRNSHAMPANIFRVYPFPTCVVRIPKSLIFVQQINEYFDDVLFTKCEYTANVRIV